MPKIYTIQSDQEITDSDKLLGTNSAIGANNATRNYTVGDLKTYMLSGVGSYVFRTVSVDGQDDVVASSGTDTLTLAAGTNIALTTDAVSKTVTVTGPSIKTIASQSLVGSGDVSLNTINGNSLIGSGNITVQSLITGAASTITSSNLAASKALTSDASGKVVVSGVSTTELGYLSGVTGALQGQVDGKISKNTGITYNVFSLAAVTQAEYNALTPLPDTIYFII